MGWVPPTNVFPDQPPANTVYMTDAPPPYPGINGFTGYAPPAGGAGAGAGGFSAPGAGAGAAAVASAPPATSMSAADAKAAEAAAHTAHAGPPTQNGW